MTHKTQKQKLAELHEKERALKKEREILIKKSDGYLAMERCFIKRLGEEEAKNFLNDPSLLKRTIDEGAAYRNELIDAVIVAECRFGLIDAGTEEQRAEIKCGYANWSTQNLNSYLGRLKAIPAPSRNQESKAARH